MNNNFEYIPKAKVVFNVTTRNAEKYICECIESVIDQNDNNWECKIINDNSSDKTWDFISSFKDKRIRAFTSPKRNYKLKNFMLNLEGCNPHDIIVELDGDDWLSHQNVVSEIRELHTKYDLVWTQCLTNIENFPNWHIWPSTNLPDDWTRKNPLRDTIWSPVYHPNHLRTFKKFLFNKIDPSNLYYDGEVIKVATDAAFYTSMIEMTFPDRRYFYDRVCMNYNIHADNITLNISTDPTLSQSFIADYLKNLPVQSRLKRQHVVFVLNSFGDLQKQIINSIRNAFPEIFLYIGITQYWNIDKYQAFCGVKFVNLEKLYQLYFEGINSTEIFKYLIGLYLLKNVRANQFLILNQDEMQKFDDFNFNWIINGTYNDEFNQIPNCIELSDLPQILRHLSSMKIINGGCF